MSISLFDCESYHAADVIERLFPDMDPVDVVALGLQVVNTAAFQNAKGDFEHRVEQGLTEVRPARLSAEAAGRELKGLLAGGAIVIQVGDLDSRYGHLGDLLVHYLYAGGEDPYAIANSVTRTCAGLGIAADQVDVTVEPAQAEELGAVYDFGDLIIAVPDSQLMRDALATGGVMAVEALPCL